MTEKALKYYPCAINYSGNLTAKSTYLVRQSVIHPSALPDPKLQYSIALSHNVTFPIHFSHPRRQFAGPIAK